MTKDFFPECSESDWQIMPMVAGRSFDAKMGPFEFRKTAEGKAKARFKTDDDCRNIQYGLHGGYLAACAEQAFYLPLYTDRCVALGRVVTIDFNMQFLQGGDIGKDLIADIELMKETGRMGFTRGTLSQDGQALCSFSATLRKLPPQA
jgi:acyl-coenzyme A thioesterase PaaI-like protein